MRTILISLLMLLAGLLGTAQAQVATTDFVPAAPVFIHSAATGLNGANITPDNPAAVAWGMPSRVAAGIIKGTDDNHAASISADFKGEFYGARLVGDRFGIAAEQSNAKGESPSNQGTLDKSHDIQLSLNLGKRLALGIGGGQMKSPVTNSQVARKELGASLRLGDVWYLGLAAYRDTNTVPGSSVSFDRNGILEGIALRTEGPWKWYAAYDHIKLNNYDTTPTPLLGRQEDRFTLQLLAGSVLLGASSAKVKPLDTSNVDLKYTVLDIGWAPMAGLNISARHQTTHVSGGINNEDVTTNSVALAWLW
jgi:hypothetical protein